MVSTVSAQNLSDDLKAIGQSIDSAKSVVISSKIKVYARKGGEVMYATEASLKRSGEISHTIIDAMEYYDNASYLMSIDHEDKEVTVISKEKNKKKIPNNAAFDLKSLEKLFETDESSQKPVVKQLSSVNGIVTYSVSKITGLKELKIVLNTNDRTLVSLSYEYSENSEYKGQYIEVSYTKFELNTDVLGSLKQSNFFTISNSKVVLNSKYKSYTIQSEL